MIEIMSKSRVMLSSSMGLVLVLFCLIIVAEGKKHGAKKLGPMHPDHGLHIILTLPLNNQPGKLFGHKK